MYDAIWLLCCCLLNRTTFVHWHLFLANESPAVCQRQPRYETQPSVSRELSWMWVGSPKDPEAIRLVDLSRTESSPGAVKDYSFRCSKRMIRADVIVVVMAGDTFCVFPPIFFTYLFLVTEWEAGCTLDGSAVHHRATKQPFVLNVAFIIRLTRCEGKKAKTYGLCCVNEFIFVI